MMTSQSIIRLQVRVKWHWLLSGILMRNCAGGRGGITITYHEANWQRRCG